VLFLRDGVLVAHDIASGQERQLASSVSEFAATPDGRRLALVRKEETQPEELWLMDRDGSNLSQVTNNTRIEGNLSWAPDGLTLAYASSTVNYARPADWISWSRWCANSEVRLLDISSRNETTLEAGCAPAFSNDGQRIAFATPPQNVASGTERMNTATEDNAIRLVNRQGQNGWNFAEARGPRESGGHLVYAPAWSPDSSQVVYNRFVGYQALVDISYIEMGNSFRGDGELLGATAGWFQQPRFSPDGSRMAVVTYDYSNAAGFTGYQIWLTLILEPGEPGDLVLPTGTLQTNAETVDDMPYATAAAWSPDGSELVVALPPGWQRHDPQEGPAFQNTTPAELWRWVPGSEPSELVAGQVDYASPVLWLPPLR
jgi:dipeptidyl aminopeptidase/acylaminoacyl peptidase